MDGRGAHLQHIVEKLAETGQIDGERTWSDWSAAHLAIGGHSLRHLERGTAV